VCSSDLTYTGYSDDEDISFKMSCFFSADLGMKWTLSDKLFLYTGAYLDYGLNDIVKNGRNRNFIGFEETSEGLVPQNNSILNSSIGYSRNTLTQNLAEKVVPVSFGIKIRFAFPL
jgi:hypothetical protein